MNKQEFLECKIEITNKLKIGSASVTHQEKKYEYNIN